MIGETKRGDIGMKSTGLQENVMRTCPNCKGTGKIEYSFEGMDGEIGIAYDRCEDCGGLGKIQTAICVCGKPIYRRFASRWLVHLETGDQHCYVDSLTNYQTAKPRGDMQ